MAQESSFVSATPDSVKVLRQQTLDRLLDLSSEQSGNSEMLEQFNLLRLQKINLNTAGFSSLLSIPFLTAPDVERILAYRKEKNGFKSVVELRKLIDEDTYELIEDFLTVGRIKTENLSQPSLLDDIERGVLWQRVKFDYIGRTLVESPLRVGFTNGAYQGSAPRIYNRIQGVVSDNLLLSALAEKDVGERSLFDFTSLTLGVRDFYNLKSLVIGDFNLSFGQGLAVQSGRAFFKSPEAVVSVKQSQRQVRPYTSTAEQNFFRAYAFRALRCGDAIFSSQCIELCQRLLLRFDLQERFNENITPRLVGELHKHIISRRGQHRV